ncbi:MAG: DUF4340 domain-containing protein [Lysobacterales bacterium]
MNKNRLLLLAVAAVVAVGIAVVLSGRQAPAEQASSGGALVDGLADSVNAVTAVSVTDGAQQVTLSRAGGVWSVAERSGYRADISALRKKLLALVESRRLEGKTTNPERYVQLGVSDLSENDGDDQNLKVDVTGEQSFQLLVGKRANARSGTYVRFADQAQSWLASGDLRFSANPKDWLKKDVLDLPANRIRRVTLVHSSGDKIALSKATPDAPNFDVTNVPEGREVLSPSAGNSIASAVAGLRFDEVAPSSSESFQQLEIVQGTFETFDGLRIGTRTFARDDKFYLMLDVAFDDALANEDIPAPALDEGGLEASTPDADEDGNFESPEMAQAAADAAEKAARVAAADSAKQEAADLAPLVNGWVFEIPSYKHGNLSKSLEDLLKPLDDGTDDGSEAEG